MTSPAKKLLEQFEVMEMDTFMAPLQTDLVGYNQIATLIEQQYGADASNTFLDFYFSGKVNEASRILLKGFFMGRSDAVSVMCFQKLESPNAD